MPTTSMPDAAELEALRLPDLQALFRRIVGEETRCPNRRFLMRRILEEGGTPRPSRKRGAPKIAKDATAMMVLPVRMDAELVARLDEAWRRRGLRSRMDLFRRALRAFLLSIGEREVATLVLLDPR